MQFLGIARPKTEFPASRSEEFLSILNDEAAHARAGYLNGTLRQLWLRGDGPGAIAIFEADSEEEMRNIAANFPLMRAGYYEFELIRLLPHGGFT